MSAQPVVVVTGASQDIGAGLVAGYRGLGYAVVANARDVVDAVLQLEEATFVTGEILPVDGGQSAGH